MYVNREAMSRVTMSSMKKSTYSFRGFTLVELMVVIAIIALLTGIIITNLTASKGKGRDAKRISDVGQIQLALELFFDRCKIYPPTITPGATDAKCPSGVTFTTYITNIPKDPAGASYGYAINSAHTDYVLYTTLESYNEAMKDSAPPPTSWSSGVTCDNTTRYCLRP
jgi:type II secretion system protein G